MKKTFKILWLFLALLTLFSVVNVYAEEDIKIYLSPSGNDCGNGTEQSPFKSLYRAREYARYLKSTRSIPESGITIILKSGIYETTDSLYLDDRDSNIHFVGEDGVTLTGAKKFKKAELNPLSSSDSMYSRIPEEARSYVKWVSLSDFAKIDEIPEITAMQSYLSDYIVSQNGERMTNARYPNSGETMNVSTVYKSGSANAKGFIIGYDDENISNWQTPSEIYCDGYGDVLWKYQRVRLSHIDANEKKIISGDSKLYSGIYVGGKIWFSNIPEELDEAGEWYIDRTEKKLYLYPNEDTEEIEIAKSKEAFFEIYNAKNITFQNIAFENTRANGAYVNGGSGVTFTSCSFKNIGGVALYIRKSYKCGLKDSAILSAGNGGLIFSSCGRKYDITPSENFALNNEICDFSWNVPTTSPAIWVDGIGDTISYNTIHESFHTAMVFYGNDNIISHNEIYNVLTFAEDAGAIYIYGDGSARGNIIEYNYIHHLGDGKSGFGGQGIFGIYFDNFNGGQTVRNNIFYDMPSAIHINGGGNNNIENNVFSEVDVPIYSHYYQTHPSSDMWNAYLKLYKDESVWLSKYPELEAIPDPTAPIKTYKDNKVSNNIFSKSGSTDSSYIYSSGCVKENNSETDEEVFADKENFDFSLTKEFSGFTPFNLTDFGINY